MVMNSTRLKEKKVPQLRFPGFEGEWEELYHDIKIKSGTPYPYTSYANNGHLLIQGANIFHGELVIDNPIYINESLTSIDHIKVKKNDILIGLNRPIINNKLKVCLSTTNYAVLYQRAGILKFDENLLNKFFLYFFLITPMFYNLLSLELVGSDQPYIKADLFKKISIKIPSLPEQTRIADFLTAVDKRITLLRKKKEALKLYKKGVMQKIFSREIRFTDDDGNTFPDWEEKRLGEIASNVMYGLNAPAVDFNGSDKYIRITDINDNSNKYAPNPLTSPDAELSDEYLVKEGDILFARTGASVGKSYLYNNDDGRLYFAGFLIRFSIKNADPKFIFSQTQTERYRKWVKVMSMRSGQPGINAEEYKSYLVKIPSLPEQQKIASLLSAIDRSIEKVAGQIELTQTWKKGLLQRMFV